MATIRIFVVFHKVLDERQIFADLDQQEVDAWFVRYGVNEKHGQKQIVFRNGHLDRTASSRRGVILEYELPNYQRELQERGFMETSCFVHVECNGLHEGADYVGVCQYDMRWTESAVVILRDLGREGAPQAVAYGIPVGPIVDAYGRVHPLAFSDRRNWPFLVESYNRFFGTTWDLEMLVDKPLTLFQTYILPRQEFTALARWLRVLCDEVYPWASQPPYETHWGSLGGYTERAESLFVAVALHERRFELRSLPLHHDSAIPTLLNVSKLHYGQ